MVLNYHIFSFRGDEMKKMNKVAWMAAIASMGTAAWMISKKMNPDMMEDMKQVAKNTASKMLTKIENM